MPPGVASLREKEGTVVEGVWKSLVIMAVGTGGRRLFVHAFKERLGRETVDIGVKDEGHYTLR